jgi:hypothetical protein
MFSRSSGLKRVERAVLAARIEMDAQKTAIDAVIVLTGCDRDTVTRFIRGLYLSGVRDPKRLTFKGLQFAAGASA